MTIAATILSVLVVGLLLYVVRQVHEIRHVKVEVDERAKELTAYKEEYKDIIDIDTALKRRRDELTSLIQTIDTRKTEYDRQVEQLNQDFLNKRSIYDSLLRELSILEENLENISYGLYSPHFDYKTPGEFKQKLESTKERQKQLVKGDQATKCPVEWTVSGSKTEGRKMTKHYSKLMLRAFNGECDAAIARVSWSNIGNMEARVNKAYEAINKLGESHQIIVTKEYYSLKMDELQLEFELEEKLHKEKEEQRKIREQMRDEEKAQREMEKVRKEAEEEEERYERALEQAKADIEKTTGHELVVLSEKIKQLEESLRNAHELKERAISQAQLTKSGYVYIISNVGSFGDRVYKIGMTRRLEPQDRIDELGDASVPFDFDVHAMIYSENAPELEGALHKRLDDRRVNLVNLRSEFFNASVDEIEMIVRDLKHDVQLNRNPEAREFRETQSIKEAKTRQFAEQTPEQMPNESGRFPSSLN